MPRVRTNFTVDRLRSARSRSGDSHREIFSRRSMGLLCGSRYNFGFILVSIIGRTGNNLQAFFDSFLDTQIPKTINPIGVAEMKIKPLGVPERPLPLLRATFQDSSFFILLP